MNILETKETVHVVTVRGGDKPRRPAAIDLQTILSRHGIQAEHHQLTLQGSVADTVLKFCADIDAGLLVMGAYQHSKLSEDLFGGVTATALAKTHLPLLLSH